MMAGGAPPPTPKLTLRDLFWLVLVAAILCAWWLDHRRQATAIERLKDPWPGYKFDIF
jgi:hypothetical protein